VPKKKQLVSLAVAAEASSLSDKTLRRYISQGRIHGYRAGPKLIRVDLDEINALLQPIPTADNAEAS
jgi:excisionase family DNA binding protein